MASGIGDFLGSFFGTTQRRDIAQGRDAALAASASARGATTAGRDAAIGAYTSAGDEARTAVSPYAKPQAYKAWSDVMGLNGAPAAETAGKSYWDNPNWMRVADVAQRSVARRNNGASGPGVYSGAGIKAASDTATRGFNENFVNPLFQRGQQEQQGAGTMADIALRTGGNIGGAYTAAADREASSYGADASTNFNAAQATAAARNTGWQNILGLGSAAISGFTPGRTGETAFGNMGRAASTGYNNLFGRA